jgi:hypothetical protein
MIGVISYDLVMEDDMRFVEGTYRIDDGNWNVFIFSKKLIEQIEIKPSTWRSGVSGVVIYLPQFVRLNKEVVNKIMSEWLGVKELNEIQGPDSMQLR